MEDNSKQYRYKTAVGLNANNNFDSVPTISVRGNALNADEIVKVAKRFGVPIVENAELARALDEIEIEEEIPAELYEAVAILLTQLEQ